MRAHLLGTCLVLAGCDGMSGMRVSSARAPAVNEEPTANVVPSSDPAADVDADVCVPVTDATRRVYEGLKPTCEGCHSQGSRGFFASAETFDALLVRDPRLVSAGKPEESELVRLLEGRGTGAFKKMPTGLTTYAELVASGAAKISIPDIRNWIQGLSAAARDARPDRAAPAMTRVTARQIQRALYQQLGLSHTDFFTQTTDFGLPVAEARSDDLYPMQGPDSLPSPRQGAPRERYYALGGGSALSQVQADPTTAPTFALTLTQLSQRWCRLALSKTPNPALLPGAGLGSPTEAEVKATIRRWYLHFLAERASDDEVNDTFRAVYQPLARQTDTLSAHAGLCSFFIRHPSWIFY